eukprot:1746488-Pyramimonas_sp.AAC.1
MGAQRPLRRDVSLALRVRSAHGLQARGGGAAGLEPRAQHVHDASHRVVQAVLTCQWRVGRGHIPGSGGNGV